MTDHEPFMNILYENAPAIWRQVMYVVSVGKTAIAGAAFGLGLFGVGEIVTTLNDNLFDYLALGGSIVGAVAHILSARL